MKTRFFSYLSHNCRLIAVYLLAAVAILSAFSYPLRAQALSTPINLTYLVQRADVIVQGQITDVQQESLPDYPNIKTLKVTIQVEAMARGPQGTTYTFREMFSGIRSKEGKKNYQVGQRLLLFLPAPSQNGLSSPIGMEQGRFHIGRDGKGNETIANEIANAGLFRNVAQDVRKEGKSLTASQQRLSATERGPVALNEFSSFVKSLTSMKRINVLSK
jgi:hypothetical protein